MSLITSTPCIRVILATALLWSCGSQAAPLAIPDFPLFLSSTGVPPNMVVTLDDSGSMSWAYTPDLLTSNYYSGDQPGLDGRRVKSSDFNPTYYNPKTTYTAPVTADGTALSTSFTTAHINGFNPVTATSPATPVNLSTAYRPTAGLGLGLTAGTTSHWFMRHYSADVSCISSACRYNSTSGTGTATWLNMAASGNSCSSSSDCWTKPMPAYYYVYDPSNANCTGATEQAKKDDEDCYDIKIVRATSGADRDGDGTISSAEADERQNFANWYSFYRTRNLMTVSAASLAMNTLPSDIRVAWQALNSCANAPPFNNKPTLGTLVTSSCRGWDTSKTAVSNAIKSYNTTQKSNFYSWLQRLPTSGGTPLRHAMQRTGNYYKTTGQNSPYDDDLTSTTVNTQAVCRKNYQILMTDGVWNSDSVSVGNYDSTNRSLPDGKNYTARFPYRDSNSNSLADLAFKYWAEDLAPSLANQVRPSFFDLTGNEDTRYFNPKNNPATWQHLVNYTVGLGVNGFFATTAGGNLTWGTNTFDGSYPQLVAGTKSWPTTGDTGPAGNAADLWHAAINSRGRFYNVRTPQELNTAFQEIVDTVSAQAAAGGGSRVSSNIARLTEANPTAFLARFADDWSGSLEAIPLNIDGTLGTSSYWEAGGLIPPGNGNAHSAPRKIFTIHGGSPQEFSLALCSGGGPLATALNKNASGVVDNLCTQRLAWLRGYTAITGASWNSISKTVTFTAPNHGLQAGNSVAVTGVTVTGATPAALQGTYTITAVSDASHFTVALATDPGGSYVTDENDTNKDNDDRVYYADFRTRSSVLGDIVNSGTVYVQKENFGYGGDNIQVTGGKDPYKTYVSAKASRVPVIYVGANDGMLHAFNAEVCTNAASCPNAGKELFAYVPADIHNKLNLLTDPGYGKQHKFYVDGTPTIGDAYIDSGWKTYLVSGLRSGGKSIFALDISDPGNFDAADVKWEFTDTDLGLTFGQPQIAAVDASEWAAIFGNGYNSTDEKAFLYIVDLTDGSLIAKIPTNSDTSNGLSTPFPFDIEGDGIVDAIYAGDLQGHLWKFVKNGTGSWSVGNGGAPLFTARNSSNQVQSITGQPKAAIVEGKIRVFFGTGRYLQVSSDLAKNDLKNDNVQSFYSIIDDSETTPGTVPRTALLKQEIVQSNVSTPLFTARTVTQEQPTPTSRGCYLDFPATPGQPSERITSTPLIKTFQSANLSTRIIFPTSIPTADPCERSGTSWLMELSTNCGRLEGTSPFDINNDQQFNDGDLVAIPNSNGTTPGSVSGVKFKNETGIVNEITWIESGDTTKGIAYKIAPGTSGNVESIANSSDVASSTITQPQRVSWEQIQ